MMRCACGSDANIFEAGRAECTRCYLKRVKERGRSN